MSHPHVLKTADRAKAFMLAGNATVTLKSLTTGGRFTYRIRSRDEGKVFFVQVMTGTDNEGSFSYLGCIRPQFSGPVYFHGNKSRVNREAPSARAFDWA